MFKFISTFRLQFLIIATFIGLFMLMSETHTNEGTSRFQSVVQTLTYPLQASVNSVASTFKNLWNSYISLIDVNEENKLLRQQLLDIEGRYITFSVGCTNSYLPPAGICKLSCIDFQKSLVFLHITDRCK